jgi:hypothetical protein
MKFDVSVVHELCSAVSTRYDALGLMTASLDPRIMGFACQRFDLVLRQGFISATYDVRGEYRDHDRFLYGTEMLNGPQGIRG